ncbi:response regulator [Luteolibacter sp. AS25]|uniref:response regulator n=1 Tax=Luteolibacter sp. AS25 TaxID=3135776 RepID=UPI00398ACBA1
MPKKILIAEDNPLMAKLTRRKLEEIGFEVEVACDGSEAISCLETSPPDLVVLDLIMPNIDGVGVLEFIRSHENLRELPVVVVSSSDYLSGVAIAAKNAGATHFFQKGDSSISYFVEEIRKILHGDVSVPYSPKTEQPTPSEPPVTDTGSRPRILLADDDRFIVRILTFLLKDAGYEVDAAVDGLDALKIASEKAPALMLLDSIMPEISGIEVLDHWKKSETLRHIPVIMITTDDDAQLRATALEKGACSFLQKPFTPQELLDEVSRCLSA